MADGKHLATDVTVTVRVALGAELEFELDSFFPILMYIFTHLRGSTWTMPCTQSFLSAVLCCGRSSADYSGFDFSDSAAKGCKIPNFSAPEYTASL